MKVRELGKSDVDELSEFEHAVLRETYAGHIPESVLGHFTVEFARSGWLNRVGGKDAILLLFLEGKLSGYTSSLESNYPDSDIRIESLYLSSMLFGKGYGSKLFLELIKELRRRGHQSAYLFVHESNTKAKDYYASIGGEVSESTIERPYFGETLYSYRVRWPDLGVLEQNLAAIVQRKLPLR